MRTFRNANCNPFERASQHMLPPTLWSRPSPATRALSKAHLSSMIRETELPAWALKLLTIRKVRLCGKPLF